MLLNNLLTSAMLSSNVLTHTIGSVLYKNADKILLGAGISMICGGTVSAIMTTTKLPDIHYDHQRCLEKAKEAPEDVRKKEVFKVYKDTVIDTLKAYGPCILLTGLGIGCIMGSHYILTSRYAALSIAYATLDKSFGEYRDRVRDVVGKEKEYDIYNNAYEVEAWDSEKDGVDKKGNPIMHKEKHYGGSKSPYAFLFDESNPNWKKEEGLNVMFLEQRQEWLNRRLDTAGVVTLAEVLYELNFFDSKKDIPSYAFDMVWVKDNPDGDGYIDFGHRGSMDFMSNRERSVWLNFNCDGLLRKVRKEKNPVALTQKAPEVAVA